MEISHAEPSCIPEVTLNVAKNRLNARPQYSDTSALKDNKEIVKLLISAHLEFMYLEFMNTALVRNFEQNGYTASRYSPYYFMGSLFNVSMKWVQNDCKESVRQITDFYYDHLFNVRLVP